MKNNKNEEQIKKNYNPSEEEKSIIIVGCGHLGSALAEYLCEDGNSVTIIDISSDSFRKLSPNFGGFIFCGDAMDTEILLQADIQHSDVVIAATNDDNVNIFIAQIAKEIYNVPRVISRLYDIKLEGVYKEFGIKTVCPSILSAEAFRSEVL